MLNVYEPLLACVNKQILDCIKTGQKSRVGKTDIRDFGLGPNLLFLKHSLLGLLIWLIVKDNQVPVRDEPNQFYQFELRTENVEHSPV
jgi:hypothetical protein